VQPPQHHRNGHRCRRFVRHNRNLVFVGFFLLIILGLVVLLFWMMSSSRFLKTG
jgi:phosphotransferase system  glucose/maltose/N-acetylglucosamine-specific IIC component